MMKRACPWSATTIVVAALVVAGLLVMHGVGLHAAARPNSTTHPVVFEEPPAEALHAEAPAAHELGTDSGSAAELDLAVWCLAVLLPAALLLVRGLRWLRRFLHGPTGLRARLQQAAIHARVQNAPDPPARIRPADLCVFLC